MNPQIVSAIFTGVGVSFSVLIGVLTYLHTRQAGAKAEGHAEARVEALGAAQSERMNALEGRIHVVEGSVSKIPEIDKAVAVLAKDFDGFRRQIETKVDESNHNSRSIRSAQDDLLRMLQRLLDRSGEGA